MDKEIKKKKRKTRKRRRTSFNVDTNVSEPGATSLTDCLKLLKGRYDRHGNHGNEIA